MELPKSRLGISELEITRVGTRAILGIRSEQDALRMAGGIDWQLTDQEIQAIEQALALWG